MNNPNELQSLDSWALAARSAQRKETQESKTHTASIPNHTAPKFQTRGEALIKAVPPHLRSQCLNQSGSTIDQEKLESAARFEPPQYNSKRLKALIDAIPAYLRRKDV